VAARFLCEQRLVCSGFCSIIDSDHIWEKMLRILGIYHDSEDFTRAQAQVQYLLTPYKFGVRIGRYHFIDCTSLHMLIRPYYTTEVIAKELQTRLNGYDGECFHLISKDIDLPTITVNVKIDMQTPLYKIIKVPKYKRILIFL
jgi:hypothetical protein